MLHENTIAIKTYRWVVFGLALFYFFYLFTTTNYDAFGLQFRFLTVWGLCASLLSAWWMVRRSMGWSAVRHDVWAGMAVVLNATVVLMYWKIYFTDPALFYGDGGGPEHLHQEYYLHAVGPALQIIDALFILGVFTRLKRTVLAVSCVPVAYIAWAELVLQPLNETPAGSVTTGLPYLFLNNMEFDARVGFYGTTIVTMLVLFAAGVAISWVLRRLGLRPAPA